MDIDHAIACLLGRYYGITQLLYTIKCLAIRRHDDKRLHPSCQKSTRQVHRTFLSHLIIQFIHLSVTLRLVESLDPMRHLSRG